MNALETWRSIVVLAQRLHRAEAAGDLNSIDPHEAALLASQVLELHASGYAPVLTSTVAEVSP